MKRNLKQARVDAKKSQHDIAVGLGISVQAVYQWEQGRTGVARKHWKRLASMLCVSESELEEVLVRTMLDASITTGNPRPLLSAQSSRMYRPELLSDALAQFEGKARTNPPQEDTTAELKARVEVLELQNKLLRLEKENAELKRELERRHPAGLSTLSALTINHHELEVKK